MEKIVTLSPIKETTEDFDTLEARIKDLFKRLIYQPLLKELGHDTDRVLMNAADDAPYKALIDALFSGRVTFSRGQFSGRFSAKISLDLQAIGARWDRKSETFRLLLSDIPPDLRSVIAASEAKFLERMSRIDKKLAAVVPEEVADKLKAAELFDRTLWKTDKQFTESVKKITIAPKLSDEARKKIADEWQSNMRLWIKDFTEKEIKELRAKIQKSTFQGNRYGAAVKTIQKSYGVTANKAKFLARQETSLLMTKFKEARYADAGVHEYTWHNVAGSKNHPVRPRHKALGDASKKGKIYRFDDPPVTTAPGEPERRNNPGQDYNCRCFARPVVRFKTK